jgi:hypothetical protein
MNFELFESMSLPEAQEHLQYFLDTESTAIEAMRPAIEEAGFTMDYSMTSLSPILKWILNKIEIVRVPVPETEPDWIRQAHREGLVDFPEQSKYLILRAAYYLGESFVRTYPLLQWAPGNPEYIEKNMPVVAGFRFGKELAPMMIMENLYSRILGDGAPDGHVDVMIETWQSFLEEDT